MTAKMANLQLSNIDKASYNLHYLPAQIDHNGQANVKAYFESTIRKEEHEKMTASLRGRPLKGMLCDVPQNYIGVVIKETKKSLTEDEERELTAMHSFKTFNYWNLDLNPSESDNLQQALHWIDVAQVLHSSGEPSQSDSQKSEVSI